MQRAGGFGVRISVEARIFVPVLIGPETQTTYRATMGIVSLYRGTVLGAWHWQTMSPFVQVKERVELCLHSLSVSS
jgi:hypothetical protein